MQNFISCFVLLFLVRCRYANVLQFNAVDNISSSSMVSASPSFGDEHRICLYCIFRSQLFEQWHRCSSNVPNKNTNSKWRTQCRALCKCQQRREYSCCTSIFRKIKANLYEWRERERSPARRVQIQSKWRRVHFRFKTNSSVYLHLLKWNGGNCISSRCTSSMDRFDDFGSSVPNRQSTRNR